MAESDQLTPTSTYAFPSHKTIWEGRGGFSDDILYPSPPPDT